MNISDYMKQMKRVSKKDDIPGAVDAYLEEECPSCGKKLKLMKRNLIGQLKLHFWDIMLKL